MIEKLDPQEISPQFIIEAKINEIIDVVNAQAREPKTDCIHLWDLLTDVKGKPTGEYGCLNCSKILDCDHRWLKHATDENRELCAECGMIKPCEHEWFPSLPIGYICQKRGIKQTCDHEWEIFGTFQRCKKCDILKEL